MRRPTEYADTRWDDPLWLTVRMCLDVLSGHRAKARALTQAELLDALTKKGTTASKAFVQHLERHPDLLGRVGEYMFIRQQAGEKMFSSLLRTEEEAESDLRAIAGRVAIAKYGTQNTAHHQSAKVIAATVNWMTADALAGRFTTFDPNPQSRVAVFEPGHLFVSPRRLDGAIPTLLNPVGIWEVKEYWGKTKGGSKMSDAIYECQLVGSELRTYEDRGGRRIRHYFILDGLDQWQARRSDLLRAFDLLASGLVDELIVGREVLTDWPRVVVELADLAEA